MRPTETFSRSQDEAFIGGSKGIGLAVARAAAEEQLLN
jgi:hypothetical protein